LISELSILDFDLVGAGLGEVASAPVPWHFAVGRRKRTRSFTTPSPGLSSLGRQPRNPAVAGREAIAIDLVDGDNLGRKLLIGT